MCSLCPQVSSERLLFGVFQGRYRFEMYDLEFEFSVKYPHSDC